MPAFSAADLIQSFDASLILQLTSTDFRGERLRPAPGLDPPLILYPSVIHCGVYFIPLLMISSSGIFLIEWLVTIGP